MTYAAKGYFDALVKMGELASESQGSKELGKSLIYCEIELQSEQAPSTGMKPEFCCWWF